MNLNQIHNVYFVGIGGIGMSALARYFKNIGKQVCGYDNTPSMLTNELIESGIDIHFEDNIASLRVLKSTSIFFIYLFNFSVVCFIYGSRG